MKILAKLSTSWLCYSLSAIGLIFATTHSVIAEGVTITSYGHSALLIKGSGKSVLTNPFKAVGCAEGLEEPKISVDLILASSRLADEGAQVAKGKFLVEPGSYRLEGLQIEGFSSPHDRLNGRRFGQATLWRWQQGGLSIAHLGGSAAPLSGETKVMLGRPDILIIGVGGGAKVYNGMEAAAIVKELNPKNVIPVQYTRDKAPKNCDQKGIDSFLKAMDGIQAKKTGNTINLHTKANDQTLIHLLQ